MSLFKYITLFLIIFFSSSAFSQKLNKSPKKATIYSSIIPGMGQIYSKKYWKVPIIYAGLITSAYYTHSNFNKYNSYKTSYLNRLDGIETDEYVNSYTNDQLKTLSEFYRRNTEISALLFSLTYLLNIIDASVSAHLFEYEITKDLSLEIKPTRFYNENLNGLCLSLKLHK